MKSEKAKAIIRENDFYFSIDGVAFHESRAMMKRDAVKAVELAEQEAEERIRAKAIEAFKSSCKYQDGCLGANRKCDKTQCAYLNEFIQKLNEL